MTDKAVNTVTHLHQNPVILFHVIPERHLRPTLGFRGAKKKKKIVAHFIETFPGATYSLSRSHSLQRRTHVNILTVEIGLHIGPPL